MSVNIGVADSVIVVPCMAAVLCLGLWIGHARQSSADYFLGNRSLPRRALLLSIVATETGARRSPGSWPARDRPFLRRPLNARTLGVVRIDGFAGNLHRDGGCRSRATGRGEYD